MGAKARRARTAAAIEAVYARLPRLECKGLCTDSCGPAPMTKPEWLRIIRANGGEPQGDGSLTCPLLDKAAGRCRVYPVRPLVCRLFGMVEAMRCPFGCIPERWLTDAEAGELWKELRAIETGSASAR